jgi:hypothetical protein
MDKITISNIPDNIVTHMIKESVWEEQCPIAISDLAFLQIPHYDFDAKVQMGELVIYNKIAERAARIFEKLFEMKFPIHKMQLMEHYGGDDYQSMDDNNSSCFNYRKIVGGQSSALSKHAYGLAIDINPLQNPYIVFDEDYNTKIFPKAGAGYLNRANIRPGMVEPIIDIFKQEGFQWGGDWNTPIDYHHFQMSQKSFGL